MFSTYRPDDVTLLLKDISGALSPMDAASRERQIQNGVHYSELLPLEYAPTKEYYSQYQLALAHTCEKTACAVACVSEWIWREKGSGVVLVSLARAGISPGVLTRRYLRRRYGVDVPHYSISIIKGRGIDHNAMRYILERHPPEAVQFVDGWTGKGAIQRELFSALQNARPFVPGTGQLDPGLAVIADPGAVAARYGTREDLLIGSSLLNCTVSGLISRTVLRRDLIGPRDFHGAVFYSDLIPEDLTYQFIEAVESCFPAVCSVERNAEGHGDGAKCPDIDHAEHAEGPDERNAEGLDNGAKCPDIDHAEGAVHRVEQCMAGRSTCNPAHETGLEEVQSIGKAFGIRDIDLIKPGIGEATRVLLRRFPWKILVYRLDDYDDLGHIYQLAKEKSIPVETYPLRNYKACGLIRTLSDT